MDPWFVMLLVVGMTLNFAWEAICIVRQARKLEIPITGKVARDLKVLAALAFAGAALCAWLYVWVYGGVIRYPG